MATLYVCLVCGWAGLEECPVFPFGSHEICSCCGSEYGLDIQDESDILIVRREWLEDGAPWFDDEDDVFPRRPIDWSVGKAMAQIKNAFGS